jgi:hypothetical protein
MFYIPKNTDLYLNEFCNDWETPDPNYYSVLCHNVVKRILLVDSFSYFEIIDNLLLQKYKKH